MKKKAFRISRRSIAMTLALALIVGILFMIPTMAADTSPLGQLTDYFSANASTFTLNANSRFFLAQDPTDEVTKVVQLAQSQFAADGIPTGNVLDIVWGDTKMVRAGDILIKMVSSDANIGAEGYKLEITSYATVTALDVRGLMYGLNMLQKHFRRAGSNSIVGFTCYDTPDTAERVISLDCARKYLTKNWICNFVREMAWMGYNTLQLHFSEDSGFRVDLWDQSLYQDYNGDGVKYEPKNDFTWLCGGQPTTWTHNSTLTGINYANYPEKNNFLSMAEVIEILETCKDYNISVIPSFDTPAHLDYTTWKFEQNYLTCKSNGKDYSFYSTYDQKTYYASDINGCINYNGATGYTVPQWPYYTSVNINDVENNQARAFILELYIDMANFFKEFAGSTDFGIGADEVNMSYNKTWDYNDFVTYINDLNDLLNGKGYTVRMYNDFMANTNYSSTIPYAENIEILYWVSPFNPNNGQTNEPYQPVSYFVGQNRVLYNCIQTNTYYVLRINDTHGDARSKYCRQWTFYHSDEESIYNEWYPADISEHGDYSEDVADVSGNLLGGGYFLIWNDYAMVNTEVEMWNGVYDNAKKTGEFYSLLNRMWSNSIKQWNWDINNTSNGGINYATFAGLRNSMGDFPGLGDGSTACSALTTLPASTEPILLADHTKLTAALATKIAKGEYTDASYSAYEDAYDAAVLANSRNNATAAELGEALDNLNKAIAGLKVRTDSFTVTRKTEINGTEYVIDSIVYDLPVGSTNINLYIPALNGYKFLRAEIKTEKDDTAENGTEDTTQAVNFTPTPSGDGSGYLSGNIPSDTTIVVWYENQADTGRLNDLVEEAITEQGSFTYSSWNVYLTALDNARNFTMTTDTRQADIDKLVKALESARSALVVDCVEPTAITIERVSSSFLAGQQVGLHVKTTSDVPQLILTDSNGNVIEQDFCSGEVQTMLNGETVKYWVLFFTVEEAGTYTYTISYRNASADIDITVQ